VIENRCETNLTDELQVILDDVCLELKTLITRRPFDEKKDVKLLFTPLPGLPPIEKILGCQNCKLSYLVAYNI
jgi:hypothetical protein